MNPTSDPCRYRLHLLQVGPSGVVSAIAEQLDGASRGNWNLTTDTPLMEFLARPNYEIPDGTPLIRLDLSGFDTYLAHVIGGPGWRADIPAGHIEQSIGRYQRYSGESWEQLSRTSVAGDVYARLAPTVGVVVQRLPGPFPTSPP